MYRPILSTLIALELLVLPLACTETTPREAETRGEHVEQIRKPDVPFVTTPQDVVEAMLKVAAVTDDDLVYDLGCGDGRIVVTAAKLYGARAVGFDIDPERVAEAWENVRKNRVEHLVEIRQKDIFTIDLSRASVVMMYLAPKANTRLIPQLEKLRPGSRIVSHDVGLEGIEADEVVEVPSEEDGNDHTIYLWTAPIGREPDHS